MSALDLTARDLAAAVRHGDTTPQSVAAEARARAEARNPAINAICFLNPAFDAEAEAVATRLAAGEDLPLAGVPLLIKDNIWVKGLRVAQGSRLFADHVAPEEAEAVRRLRAAGATILGIATCSEFACKGATNSPLHGVTRNPVNLEMGPGGSSGGSVAAVRAGIVPLALGTDAGGSSRRPPAHTGLCGMKPTMDLIPYGPSFDEPVWGISVICPIARDVGDIALAMEVLAGVKATAPDRIRLAVSPDFGTGQLLEADVATCFDRLTKALKAAGAHIEDAVIDWGGIKGHDVLPLQFAGLALAHGDVWRRTPEIFDPVIAAQIETGLGLSGVEVAAAHQISHRMREALRSALSRHGVIATPTTPCPAWPAELSAPQTVGGRPAAPRDHAAFTPQVNHAGVAAISVPCGTDSTGLPLGLQLIADAGCDGALIGLAQAVEPILKRCA
ncbi:amidase [Roseobacter sinensis]|uniref:Amidase n=1 Tax=Roseobacter sinensis TaxID=2931391 RepID=A0ABT3BIS4_9RHOB|nr:amidase [Roseobacter sp. WL0113]MCV3273452.1 amidase [Roseobacter sp. WL0113]